MKSIYKQYISDIKILFPSWGRDERNYISKFKQNLLDDSNDESIISKEDLYGRYGSPKDVVNSYYENIDIDNTIKRIRISKYIKYFIVTLILCALICASAFALNMYHSYKVFERQEAVLTEEVVEEYDGEIIDGKNNIE